MNRIKNINDVLIVILTIAAICTICYRLSIMSNHHECCLAYPNTSVRSSLITDYHHNIFLRDKLTQIFYSEPVFDFCKMKATSIVMEGTFFMSDSCKVDSLLLVLLHEDNSWSLKLDSSNWLIKGSGSNNKHILNIETRFEWEKDSYMNRESLMVKNIPDFCTNPNLLLQVRDKKTGKKNLAVLDEIIKSYVDDEVIIPLNKITLTPPKICDILVHQ